MPTLQEGWRRADSRQCSEETFLAEGNKPRPRIPQRDMLVIAVRKDDYRDFADEMVFRNSTDIDDIAAVAGVVSVVAHDKVMVIRHDDAGSIIEGTTVVVLEGRIAHAVIQSLLEMVIGVITCAEKITAVDCAEVLSLDGRVVNIEEPLFHLHSIAGQSHQSFDVVYVALFWIAEHQHIAAFWLR